MRRHVQMVFQDPYGSLSPRRTVAEIIAEPLEVVRPRQARGASAASGSPSCSTRSGCRRHACDRYPRAVLRRPAPAHRHRAGASRSSRSFIVADEPVSALDVSIQAQIINLLQDLQEQKGFSYLFIAHDLAVVRHIADRVAVMYLGRIVEIGPKRAIYAAPAASLYAGAAVGGAGARSAMRTRKRIMLEGDVPSPSRVPSGCSFHTRCPIAQDICSRERPPLREVAHGQRPPVTSRGPGRSQLPRR